MEKDCPNAFANDVELTRDMRQYEAWLKADGLKGVSIEEIYKGMKMRGKQVMPEPVLEVGPGDKMDMLAGEEFAMQAINLEGNQNTYMGGQSIQGLAGGHAMGEGNNMAGMEYIIQNTGASMNQF